MVFRVYFMGLPLSIIIPAYDEQVRLGDSLREIIGYLRTNDMDAEVIVVDDGSGDDSARVAARAFAEFPSDEAAGTARTQVIRYQSNRGKGYAVRTGLRAAKGEIALFSDADLATPISELPKLVDPIKNGEYDVTFGSRALDRALIGTHQPWRREQGGKVFNFIVKQATGMPYWDTQCGFKAFNMSKFRPLLEVMTIDRFGFDVEFLYVAQLAGLKLKEIPVRWNHVEGTKVSVWRDSRRMMQEVRLIRKQAIQGLYGKACDKDQY
jgi:glycosyltransferase involved in cell wall biosynthesis